MASNEERPDDVEEITLNYLGDRLEVHMHLFGGRTERFAGEVRKGAPDRSRARRKAVVVVRPHEILNRLAGGTGGEAEHGFPGKSWEPGQVKARESFAEAARDRVRLLDEWRALIGPAGIDVDDLPSETSTEPPLPWSLMGLLEDLESGEVP